MAENNKTPSPVLLYSSRIKFRQAHTSQEKCLLCQEHVPLSLAYHHTKSCLQEFEETFGTFPPASVCPPPSAVPSPLKRPHEEPEKIDLSKDEEGSKKQKGIKKRKCTIPTTFCEQCDKELKKMITFQGKSKSVTLCKFQHLKSKKIREYVKDELMKCELIPAEEGETFTCDICKTKVDDCFEISGKLQGTVRALHRICTWRCFEKNVIDLKQGDWEYVVENNTLLDFGISGNKN
jgi:hypothetical protein